jgi:predicted acetyltransferase
VTAIRRGFGGRRPTAEEIHVGRLSHELDRTLAVFDGPEIVGTSEIFSFGMTVPGGACLPCGGVTRVTVRSTHRRRGLLSRMMERELLDMHDRGEPLAALYASEAPIYGRFGYGLATYELELEIPRTRSAFRRPVQVSGRILLVDKKRAESDFSSVMAQALPQRPGMLKLPGYWWQHDLTDLEPWREGASEQYLAIYEDEHGRATGFALYRVKLAWTDNQPDGTLVLVHLVTATDDAYAALWRYLLDVDLMARVSAWMRPVDEPLRFLLVDARAPKAKLNESLWLRLVDVREALRRRGYRQPGAVTIDVRDPLCRWNTGRFTLEASETEATCEPASGSVDLALDIGDLAALYLGGNSAHALQSAGRIDEQKPGSVSLLHKMFQGAIAPWNPIHF